MHGDLDDIVGDRLCLAEVASGWLWRLTGRPFSLIPAAAALLLWPAVWNGYPIVFADTGTYLSQAIHRYAGWDRPVFYSLFMLPLHATVTVWPVLVVQALLAAWVLWLVCRVLVPGVSAVAFVGGVGGAVGGDMAALDRQRIDAGRIHAAADLVLCLLAWVPERLSRGSKCVWRGLAAFMIASQQSSVALAFALLGLIVVVRWGWKGATADRPLRAGWENKGGASASAPRAGSVGWRVSGGTDVVAVWPMRRWLLIVLPPALAVVGLCTVNLVAHGRFAVSPFGNVFLLARVIYDGPGMAVLRRDCPVAGWRLCPFVGDFPATSDEFLWTPDGPLRRAGGAKVVSAEAGAIVGAALMADPVGAVWAALRNTLEQLSRFESGDGLTAWPAEVSGWIERDFPAREAAAYAAARQQRGVLTVPVAVAEIHWVVGLAGMIGCALLLPVAWRRRAACGGFLLVVLVALPVSAAITGGLSAPHDRYQSRIVWLAPFVAVVSLASLRRSGGRFLSLIDSG